MIRTLFPNALSVARREYLERVRSRAFVLSTAVLVLVAVAITFLPVLVRYLDQGSVTRIGVYSVDETLAQSTVGALDAWLNPVPHNEDPGRFEKEFRVERIGGLAAGVAAVDAGKLGGLLAVERVPSGGLAFTYHANVSPVGFQALLMSSVALGVSVQDWRASFPAGSAVAPYTIPRFEVEPTTSKADEGPPPEPQQVASQSILGFILVVLIFITSITYGMWIATSVAAEKSSRVMELLISAASPLQLLIGKVLGVGSAGLTQYLAIALPASVALLLQDRVATLVLGATAGEGGPLVGLTVPSLLAYGLFFLLGLALYGFIYAAAGSLVSRQDDVQQLAMPLSLLAMAGYILAILGFSAIDQPWVVVLSFVPFFSPYVMLARVLVGHVPPWEIALSVGLLVLSVLLALVVAARVYRAGVLLYGQRPGFRVFVAAVRSPG